MEDGFSRGDLAAIDEVVSPDFVEHEVGPGQDNGRDGLKAIIAMLRAAFSDLKTTIEDVFTSGDRLCARVMFQGTHEGEFQGLPPTGRKATWEAIDICRVDDGRLLEHWGQLDRLGLLEQLGAIPQPASSG
jgi:predicted ester cyclase